MINDHYNDGDGAAGNEKNSNKNNKKKTTNTILMDRIT